MRPQPEWRSLTILDKLEYAKEVTPYIQFKLAVPLQSTQMGKFYLVVVILTKTNVFLSEPSSVTYRSPSTLVLKYNLSMIFFPDCDDPLVSSEDSQPQCGLAPRSLAKV